MLLLTPLARIDEEFAQGLQNHGWFCSCGAPPTTRQVMDAYFVIAASCLRQLVQYFRIDHGAACLYGVRMQKFRREELEGTVYIADVDA